MQYIFNNVLLSQLTHYFFEKNIFITFHKTQMDVCCLYKVTGVSIPLEKANFNFHLLRNLLLQNQDIRPGDDII